MSPAEQPEHDLLFVATQVARAAGLKAPADSIKQARKLNSSGFKLDVLTGHPEHDLLFLATQAATAAGLNNAKVRVSQYINRKGPAAHKLGEVWVTAGVTLPSGPHLKNWKQAWLMDESALYSMLLRGNATASEPFRKWVTEEVLPTIRKTGKYDAEQSTNPIAQGVMDELKTMFGEA